MLVDADLGDAELGPLRVLLVDDEELTRRGMAIVLAGADDVVVVGEVDRGEEATAAARLLEPDVVLLDAGRSAEAAAQACRGIGAVAPGARILLMVSGRASGAAADAPDRTAMAGADGRPGGDGADDLARLGVAGIIAKDSRADDLLSAVRRCAGHDTAPRHREATPQGAGPGPGWPGLR